jgi:hypothetical protein
MMMDEQGASMPERQSRAGAAAANSMRSAANGA